MGFDLRLNSFFIYTCTFPHRHYGIGINLLFMAFVKKKHLIDTLVYIY